jgi:hypothetical protein
MISTSFDIRGKVLSVLLNLLPDFERISFKGVYMKISKFNSPAPLGPSCMGWRYKLPDLDLAATIPCLIEKFSSIEGLSSSSNLIVHWASGTSVPRPQEVASFGDLTSILF